MRGLNSISGWLLAGLLCCGAYAAQDDRPVKTDDERAAEEREHRESRADQRELAKQIERRLNADPLFAGTRVMIDLYGGLAIVHGSAANENMILAVNTKLRNTAGVEVIYNYMTSPAIVEAPDALRVTYEKFDRVDDVGVRNNSYVLAERVEDRLLADPRLAGAGLDVDSYLGLIIVHGRVDTRRQADLVRDIAAFTDGVEHVISFVQVAGDPMMAPVTVAPVFERSMAVDVYEPVPISVEYIPVSTTRCCP